MLDEEKFESKKSDKAKQKFVVRTPMEAQRVKLEKLMSDPTKPVIIPTAKQKKDFANAIPSFIRNVMGSSAGAGSGEFHVYRHLRRKEYARQKHIQQKSKKETLDDEYQQKLDNNRLQSEEKTAKKRAKRLKKKMNAKNRAKMPKIEQPAATSENESEDDEADNDGKQEETTEETTETNSATDNATDASNSTQKEIQIAEKSDDSETKEGEEDEKISNDADGKGDANKE